MDPFLICVFVIFTIYLILYVADNMWSNYLRCKYSKDKE